MTDKEQSEEKDYDVTEDGRVVFTKEYHLKRGYCCGNRCLNCPYQHEACSKVKNEKS